MHQSQLIKMMVQPKSMIQDCYHLKHNITDEAMIEDSASEAEVVEEDSADEKDTK